MNRRTRIMALYANLRAELRQEIEERGDVSEPDNLDEANWALGDSDRWYHGTQGAVDAPDNLERRVDAYLDANLPNDVRKDAERWAAVKKVATCGCRDLGRRSWFLGALPSESTDVTEAIDAEIERRSERKDGET